MLQSRLKTIIVEYYTRLIVEYSFTPFDGNSIERVHITKHTKRKEKKKKRKITINNLLLSYFVFSD